ncbi:MAG: magnesium transporter, partial [Candidatus Bathyarchaeota archaeon]|nr:magnesium transporter [Candidatus Bathyarchaeota archaeon]
LIKNRREEEFAKTVKEFLLTLFLVAFIVNVTGLILGEISQAIGDRPEIYVVYPALIDTVGDVGSIVGSTATTNLALGTLRPTFSSIKQHLAVIGDGWIASVIMFMLFFTAASTTHGTAVLGGLSKFAAQILITNVLSVSAIVIISYAVAINTYKRGWDPDNFVIPIESSLADSITSLSLLIAVTTIV